MGFKKSLIWDVELIDTLWNVNEVLHELEDMIDARINRYIMECK